MTTPSSTPEAVVPSTEESLNPPRPSIDFVQCIELGYEEKQSLSLVKQAQVCFECGQQGANGTTKQLATCAKCQVATYCSRECQLMNWKKAVGHKYSCTTYGRVGSDMQLKNEEDKSNAKAELYGKIRFYVCPYAVFKFSCLGKGFLFIQSDCTLAELSLLLPKNTRGHDMGMRSVLVHYLTVGEFDSEICRDDFELAEVRGKLRETIDTYDPETSVAILMRFRCGHVGLGTAPLVPDYALCKSLGKDYYSDSTAGALQLNIDET